MTNYDEHSRCMVEKLGLAVEERDELIAKQSSEIIELKSKVDILSQVILDQEVRMIKTKEEEI